MTGHLAETLALSKKELTRLLAALLLIGGTRRDRPRFCHLGIVSFPLHNFFDDTLSTTVVVTNAALRDLVKDNFVLDVLTLQPLVTEASLRDLVLPLLLDAALLLSAGVTAGSFSDLEEDNPFKFLDVLRTEFVVTQVLLRDNVKQAQTPTAVLVTTATVTNATLDDL